MSIRVEPLLLYVDLGEIATFKCVLQVHIVGSPDVVIQKRRTVKVHRVDIGKPVVPVGKLERKRNLAEVQDRADAGCISVDAGRKDVRKRFDVIVEHPFESGSRGRLVNVQPGFQSDQTVEVFSLAMDFVF